MDRFAETTAKKAGAAVAIIEVSRPAEFEGGRDTHSREVLILRRAANQDDPWSGHYSFPGGRYEEGDLSLLATAIRETEEETGILLSEDTLIAALPPTPAARSSISPIVVHPFHFLLPQRPAIQLNSHEMQSAYWLDLSAFLQPHGHIFREMIPKRLPGRLYPAWPVEDYFLWGFTYELILKVFGKRKRE